MSERELEVLRLVCEGETYKGIAKKLGITRSTVETHLEKLRKEFQARNTAHLAAQAIRQGLV